MLLEDVLSVKSVVFLWLPQVWLEIEKDQTQKYELPIHDIKKNVYITCIHQTHMARDHGAA